jgi:hypothetical protein
MRLLRALLVGLLCLAPIAVAHAQFTKAAIGTQVTTDFPDNVVGAITPAVTRTFLNNLVNSYQQYTGVNAQTGTSYTFTVNDYGQLVTFNNSGAVAVTLPQATGTFTTWNTYVNNVGSGTVTITPTTSTINGSSTLALGQNQGAFIVSDGTNYQTFRGFGTGTVSGPGSSTTGDLVTWGNNSGTVVADLNISAAGQVVNSTAAHTESSTATPTLGVAGTTTGSLALANGGASGQSVTIKNPSTTSAWEFDLPTSAGSANQILTSQAGAGTPQTYQNISALLTQGTGLTFSGTTNVTINLTTPVSVANGGIGVGTLAAHGALIGEGTSAVVSVTTGSSSLCLLSNAGADPTWGSCSGGSSVVAGYGISVNGTTVSAPYTAPYLAQASDL